MGWKKIKKLQAQNHNDPQTSTNFCKDPQSAHVHENIWKVSCYVLLKSFRRNANEQRANPCRLPRAPHALHQSLEHRAGEHATTSRYNRKARHNDAKQMQHGCTDAKWMQMNNLGTMYQNSVTLNSFAATGYQKPRGLFRIWNVATCAFTSKVL